MAPPVLPNFVSSRGANHEPHDTASYGASNSVSPVGWRLPSSIPSLVPRLAARLFRHGRGLALLALACITMLVFLSPSSSRIPSHDSMFTQSSSYSPMTRQQLQSLKFPGDDDYYHETNDLRLRVFMPADSPHINLCKEIVSAMALGYPAPTLLNWKGEFNRPAWHLAGSHIAKIESLLSVIEDLLDNSDGKEDDIALLVDAYDIWFQLPPIVLLQRFHRLNREADERIQKQWERLQSNTTDAEFEFPVPPPRQNIIVTSAKDCSPLSDSGSHPHYEHWPESPMPSDMFGEDTDKVTPHTLDPSRKYKNIRPRCVNSGMVMGTLGALRKALLRARTRVETAVRNGRQLWSDQALLGEVIGEQEMWREWIREMAAGWNGSASVIDPSALDRDVDRIAAAAQSGTNLEFGIGLDYGFEMIPPTCSAEEGGFFVKLNDKQAVANETTKAGVLGDVRVDGIPKELQEDFPDYDVLRDIAWGDMPLYTDFFFGTTPVGIHHNAFVNGLKPWRLKNWWELMWFHPHLRQIAAKQLRPLGWGGQPDPIANLTLDDGKIFVYYAPLSDLREKTAKVYEPPRKNRRAEYRPIVWDSVCQRDGEPPWHEELFGDGKGPLII